MGVVVYYPDCFKELLILLLSPSTSLCFWVWMEKRGRGQITKIISVHSKTKKKKGEKTKEWAFEKEEGEHQPLYLWTLPWTLISLHDYSFCCVALSSYWVCKYEYRWNRFTFLRGKLRDSLAPGVDPFSSHMLGGNNSFWLDTSF